MNGYYALAAADRTGAIMKDARGEQIVYLLGAPAAAPTIAPATQPAVEKP